MRPWIAPVAVALLSSAWPLVQVEVDHSSPPRQTMLLTQRELVPQYQGEQYTGSGLNWSWSMSLWRDSIPSHELVGLGIVCTDDGYDCTSGWKRRGWIVVGLDSVRHSPMIDTLHLRLDSLLRLPSTDSLRIHHLAEVVNQLDYQLLHTSRLKMVAVGSDPEQLAGRWNDGAHLVLAAKLSAYRISWPRDTLPGQEAFYRVSADPLPRALYLSREQAAEVHDSAGYDRRLYSVTVGVGSGWLPRVLQVVPGPTLATLADSVHLYQSLMQ